MTTEQRARVHPLRASPVPLPAGRSLGWHHVSAFWKDAGTFWVRGLPFAEVPHATRERAIVAELGGGVETGAKDPATEATLLVMMDFWSRRALVLPGIDGPYANDRYRPVDEWLVSRWVSAGGLEFALDVVATFPSLDTDRSRMGDVATHALMVKAGAGKWWCLESGHLGLLHALRRWVVAASPADYEAARAHAAHDREQAAPWMRAALAFVFPDEVEWAEADLALAKKPKAKARLPPWTWGLLTTAITNPTELAATLDSLARDDQSWESGTEHYGLSLVDRLGDLAAPMLIAALGVARTVSMKRALAEALALTEAAETRVFFEANRKQKAFGEVAEAYLAACGS